MKNIKKCNQYSLCCKIISRLSMVMPSLIPALCKLMQEDCERKASLDYIVMCSTSRVKEETLTKFVSAYTQSNVSGVLKFFDY